MMVKTEPLRKIISLAVASAYVKNENSVSVLILAKPESGKTTTMKEFALNNGIGWLSDVSYTGLLDCLEHIKQGTIKTLFIPDMLKPFVKKKDTATNFLTLLNEMIEEGVKTIKTFQKNIDYGMFLRCNAVCAITSTDFFTAKGLLGGIGFISRVIPFSYSYSINDINKIFKALMKNNSNEIEFQKLNLKKVKHVHLPPSLAEKIKSNITLHLVEKFKRRFGDQIYGFRLQKNLQTLAKASALLRKSDKVTIKDVNELEKLSNWMNYDFKNL
ncbi:MAG: hypothetical protein NZ942_01990 [Candidatus Aenigmarchaeota archaeon]|nr:hypothetical protein [Candidatus Aenigmarchaeota archaeon]